MTTNNNMKVSISSGNRKMGAIPSVSLPACTTCNPDAPCFKECYARRMSAFRKTVKNAYDRNLSILESDSSSYWVQVRAAVAMSRFFRFHVSGDIPNKDYFAEMVNTAEMFPNTEILVFTKQYDIVNKWMDENGGNIPENLHVLFSFWTPEWNATINNKYNFPVAQVIFKGENPDKYAKTCGGNCTECACLGTGCWTLEKGETIGLMQH